MRLQAAIDAPMFRNDHMPNWFYPRQAQPGALTLEGEFSPEMLGASAARGHKVTTMPDWSLGTQLAHSANGALLLTS